MIKVLALSMGLLGNGVVLNKINLLRNNVPQSTIRKISIGVEQPECKVINNENLILAIMKVESDFKIDAFNPASNDFGLMQINNWHVKRLSLSRSKLLSDAAYNMRHGCLILAWFVANYKLEEAVARWNCGTRKSCINIKRVRKFRKKVLTYKARLDNMNVQ